MIYFHHISKCAGTSFMNLSAQNVPLFRPNANGNPLDPITGRRLPYWNWSSREQRHFLTSSVCGIVANENVLGEAMQFYEGVVYVTILRDPLDRLFSAYQAHFRPSPDLSIAERGQGFAAFIESNPGKEWRDNPMVSAFTYRNGGRSAAGLDLAKQRLAEFDHIFLVEVLPKQIAEFEKYGWTQTETPWRNPSNRSAAARNWSLARHALSQHPRILDRLARENERDLELFAFACEQVERRKAELPVLRRRPAKRGRTPPRSDNFHFAGFCAYEAFLENNQPRCIKLLKHAAELPEANRIARQHNRDFVEFALSRFAVPEIAEQERRARNLERAGRPATKR